MGGAYRKGFGDFDFMRILVIAEHIADDPERCVFYNIDGQHHYIKRGIDPYSSDNNRIAYYINLFLTVISVRCDYKKLGINLIITHNSARIGFFVGLINRLTFSSVNHVIWGFNIHKPYTGVKRWISRFAFKHTRCVVVYSTHEKRTYSEMFSIPLNRFIFTYFSGPYLDDDRYRNLKEVPQHHIVSGGFSGRDYEFLSTVAARLPEISFVVLVYPWAVKGISFGSNVTLMTGVPEIEYCRYIANARLFFLPLKNRTTANGHIAIVQSMCYKTPLLTHITEGTRDYLLPNINAEIYTDGDVESAVALIRKMYTNKEDSDRMAEKAFEFAREYFSVESQLVTLDHIISLVCET